MKCTIPEISWHNREPVFSVDVFPENGQFYRLASGGGDCHVLIWQMTIASNGAVNQDLISDLTRHQRSVNCVRWSASGKYLASGDDDANIIVWQLKTDSIPLLEGETGDKETWTVYKVMRGHKEDVYDICWSIDELKLLTGSVDNTAILWDLNKGKIDHILTDHKGFVQGVAWDPKNQLLATISTDKVCRIFDNTGKHVKARIQKGKITAVPEGHFLKDKDAKYFHDDTFKSFFRRLQFTPDGSLLIVPSGNIEAENCKTALSSTLVFTIDNFSSPAVILPLPRQSSTVVRCCPILFELKEEGPDPTIKLRYRMIFAVGADHDVILYDTQQKLPFARFQEIHYTRVTDLTWSQDGLLLVASSTDGFCSLITFEPNELGTPWVKIEEEIEENLLDVSGCQELIEKDENVDIADKEIKCEKNNAVKKDLKEESIKRPSFLEQWALKTPKKRKIEKDVTSCEVKAQALQILDSPMKLDVNQQNPQATEENVVRDKTASNAEKKGINQVNIPTRRRIKPVTLDSKPSTNEIENDWAPIRLDPNVIDISCDNKASDSKDELSPREREDLAKASFNIQEFFCRQPKRNAQNADFSKATPIAVRRKPKETKVEAQSIPTLHSQAESKPIDIISSSGVVEQQKGLVEDKVKEKKNTEKKLESTSRGTEAHAKPTNQNPVDIICLDSDDECNITPINRKSPKLIKSQKKKPVLKINLSRMVKSSTPEVTPKKAKNALLSFLQKSSEKATKKAKVPKQSHMVLPIEEISARDAWSCHVAAEEVRTPQKLDESTDDDQTEDFCLQLEESQGCKERTADSQRSDEKHLEKLDLEDKKESENNAESQSSASKTPRRVPLITLCSPGRKLRK